MQGKRYETWGYGPLSHSEYILIAVYCSLVRLNLIIGLLMTWLIWISVSCWFYRMLNVTSIWNT